MMYTFPCSFRCCCFTITHESLTWSFGSVGSDPRRLPMYQFSCDRVALLLKSPNDQITINAAEVCSCKKIFNLKELRLVQVLWRIKPYLAEISLLPSCTCIGKRYQTDLRTPTDPGLCFRDFTRVLKKKKKMERGKGRPTTRTPDAPGSPSPLYRQRGRGKP